MKHVHLVELAFKGQQFTWRHGDIYEIVDKALCNLPSNLSFHMHLFIISHSHILIIAISY